MIPESFHEVRWSLALIATAILAFWRGGPPERLAITGVMVAHLITALARPAQDALWPGAQWGVIVANTETFLVALTVLALSKRWWPIPSAGFQGLSLLLYLTPLVAPGFRTIAYHFSSILFDYLNLMVICAGVLLEGPRSRVGRMTEAFIAPPPSPPPAGSRGGG